MLEHLKALALHLDLGPSDTYLWYTSPSWMVWNSLVSGLLVGATIVCYDGSPSHPRDDALWALAARHEVTVLGTSPAYLQACARAGRSPGADHDLHRLRVIGATGSVVPPEQHSWVADHVGRDVPLASVTGGTDVASGFAGFVPILPVRAGEITSAYLGVALDSWDADGRRASATQWGSWWSLSRCRPCRPDSGTTATGSGTARRISRTPRRLAAR